MHSFIRLHVVPNLFDVFEHKLRALKICEKIRRRSIWANVDVWRHLIKMLFSSLTGLEENINRTHFILICGAFFSLYGQIKRRCSEVEQVWKRWKNGWFNLNCVFNAPSKPRRPSPSVSLPLALSLSSSSLSLATFTLDFFLFHFLVFLAFCFALTLLWTSVRAVHFLSLSLSDESSFLGSVYLYKWCTDYKK